MRDVGDCHQQSPTGLAPSLPCADLAGFAVDGIIEIASIFAVDCHKGDVTQIDSITKVGWANRIWKALG